MLKDKLQALFRKNKITTDEPQLTEENVSLESGQVNMQDSYERQQYVQSLLEQIQDAQDQIEGYEKEYQTVDLYLRDMEEIEYIPPEEKKQLIDIARSVEMLQSDKIKFEKKGNRLSDEHFEKIQRLENDAPEGIAKIKEAESYQQAIREDLKRLENEKQACLYRKNEAMISMDNLRTMAILSTAAVFGCLLLLAGLQIGLHMDTMLGYLLVMGILVLILLVVYMKYVDAQLEYKRSSRSLNKVILLKNRVNIRYINNTNLLDYYYMKFDVPSGEHLEKLWNLYLGEREEREHIQETEKDLNYNQEMLVHFLRNYRLFDPLIWLHQVPALLDPREMVEVRHALITRRQKLRKQMEYNQENADKAQNLIKDMVADYPKYAKEILKMLSDFEEKRQKVAL